MCVIKMDIRKIDHVKIEVWTTEGKKFEFDRHDSGAYINGCRWLSNLGWLK